MLLLTVGGSANSSFITLLLILGLVVMLISSFLYIWLRSIPQGKQSEPETHYSPDTSFKYKIENGRLKGFSASRLTARETFYSEYDQLPVGCGTILETCWAAIDGGARIVAWREIDERGNLKLVSVTISSPDINEKLRGDELKNWPEATKIAETILDFGRKHFERTAEKLAKGERLD